MEKSERMRGFGSTVLIMWFGFYATVHLVFFYVENYKRDSIVMTMIESAKIASVTSLDDSARDNESMSIMTEDTFKSTFEDTFNKNLNINLAIKDFSYQFMKDDEEIKAVRVKVTEDDGTEYQTLLKENISN